MLPPAPSFANSGPVCSQPPSLFASAHRVIDRHELQRYFHSNEQISFEPAIQELSQITPSDIADLTTNPRTAIASIAALRNTFQMCLCQNICPEGRTLLQQLTMLQVGTHFHLGVMPENHVFQILSIGSGSCFEELAYVITLARSGRRHIHLTVIDPAQETLPALVKLYTLINLHKQSLGFSSFSCHYFPSIELANPYLTNIEYIPNLIMTIDVENNDHVGVNLINAHPQFRKLIHTFSFTNSLRIDNIDHARQAVTAQSIFIPLSRELPRACQFVDDPAVGTQDLLWLHPERPLNAPSSLHTLIHNLPIGITRDSDPTFLFRRAPHNNLHPQYGDNF